MTTKIISPEDLGTGLSVADNKIKLDLGQEINLSPDGLRWNTPSGEMQPSKIIRIGETNMYVMVGEPVRKNQEIEVSGLFEYGMSGDGRFQVITKPIGYIRDVMQPWIRNFINQGSSIGGGFILSKDGVRIMGSEIYGTLGSVVANNTGDYTVEKRMDGSMVFTFNNWSAADSTFEIKAACPDKDGNTFKYVDLAQKPVAP